MLIIQFTIIINEIQPQGSNFYSGSPIMNLCSGGPMITLK